jgi:hypothetical protein
VPARELAEKPAQTGIAIALIQGWHGAVDGGHAAQALPQALHCRIEPYIDQGGAAARRRGPGVSAAAQPCEARAAHAGPQQRVSPDRQGSSVVQTGQRCKRGHVLAATGHGHAHGTLISDTGQLAGSTSVTRPAKTMTTWP